MKIDTKNLKTPKDFDDALNSIIYPTAPDEAEYLPKDIDEESKTPTYYREMARSAERYANALESYENECEYCNELTNQVYTAYQEYCFKHHFQKDIPHYDKVEAFYYIYKKHSRDGIEVVDKEMKEQGAIVNRIFNSGQMFYRNNIF